MLALAAPDKFRGSLSAAEAARAMGVGARRAGWQCRELPLADGGEGTLDALGGANRASIVSGPLGDPVEAGWRLEAGVAVIEMARASGLALTGGATGNDPLRASTRGTGELIALALEAGAERVIVAVGGSATTDGGLGAVEVLRKPFRVPVQVACDVQTLFVDAAAVFAPQKGATPAEVEALSERLAETAVRYRAEYGVDVCGAAGIGSGGRPGRRARSSRRRARSRARTRCRGGRPRPGPRRRRARDHRRGQARRDLVRRKGRRWRTGPRSCRTLVVAGAIEPGTESPAPAISLVERFGFERAWADPEGCVADAVEAALRPTGRESASPS